METRNQTRVAVIGGGLGGLTCAALLARRGADVTVFEGSDELGGMASTRTVDGYRWNWGGHALYRGGAATSVLRDLGIEPDGARISGASFMEVLLDGALFPAPFSVGNAFSPVLSATHRLEATKVYAQIGLARRSDLGAMGIGEWLDAHVHRPRVRDLFLALIRLSSFTADPQRQSADAALQQLWISLAGVWYLHEGWDQLVRRVRAAAESAGVTIRTDTTVGAVEHGDSVEGLRLADGTHVSADAAVIAVGGPSKTVRLLDGPAAAVVQTWAERTIPVRAATWELSLSRQPDGSVWVLGIDQPVYVNVHSHFARVAPAGGAVVHVVRYLGPDDAGVARDDLAPVLDTVLPGWRDVVVDDRFLPSLTVAHDLPSAANGGVAGRPGPLLPEVGGLAIVGDWTGQQGVLADATMASAAQAARTLGLLSHRAEAAV